MEAVHEPAPRCAILERLQRIAVGNQRYFTPTAAFSPLPVGSPQNVTPSQSWIGAGLGVTSRPSHTRACDGRNLKSCNIVRDYEISGDSSDKGAR